MQGYGQFCPVAKAAEVIGTRWTPLLLRELLCGVSLFNDLQRGVPLMSRTLLAQRLRELEEAGLVRSIEKEKGRGHEYRLTEAGEALRPVIEILGNWGQRYAQARLRPEDCDPALLFWDMRRRVEAAWLPPHRFVMRFELRNLPPARRSLTTWWLVADQGTLDICLENPGFVEDVIIRSTADALARLWLGYSGLDEASRAGALRLEGSPEASRILARLLDLGPAPRAQAYTLAPAPRPHAAARAGV